MWCKHMRKVHEKKHVRCSCPHLPSVTMDRYLLSTKPTVTKNLISKKFLNSFPISIHTSPTTVCLKRDAIVCIDLDGKALQLVLLIRGVDDFSPIQRLENQIGVS